MRRVIAVFLVVEVVVLSMYALYLYGWVGAKATGIDAFPVSPDWQYNYGLSRIMYVWVQGMAVGVLLGGVSLTAISRGQIGKLWRAQVAACIALALGVAIGIVLEAIAPIVKASPLQSNSSLEQSRDT